jgi:hypothetical protein
MHFVVTLSGTISVSDQDGNQPHNVGELLTDYLSSVMDEFCTMNVMDPDIELDLAACSVKFSVLVEADDTLVAINAASPLVRSAIHGAGGSTPDWPEADDNSWAVRMITFSARPVQPELV